MINFSKKKGQRMWITFPPDEPQNLESLKVAHKIKSAICVDESHIGTSNVSCHKDHINNPISLHNDPWVPAKLDIFMKDEIASKILNPGQVQTLMVSTAALLDKFSLIHLEAQADTDVQEDYDEAVIEIDEVNKMCDRWRLGGQYVDTEDGYMHSVSSTANNV